MEQRKIILKFPPLCQLNKINSKDIKYKFLSKAKAEKDGSWYFFPSVNSTEKNVLRKIEEKITQLLH